jgi:WD40 repeat protein
MKRQLTERTLMTVVTVLLLMTSSIAAQNNVNEAELQFREALHKQQVEGDLNSAVKMYQSLITAKATDRVVKAKALLQLAIANEALGKESEALNSYEQIVRDFADQPAVAQARTKIAAHRPLTPPPTMTMRKIEFGADLQDVVATDGEKAVYWDSNRTTLYFGDVKGRDKRIVFQRKERIPEIFVSRDFMMIFLYIPGSRPESTRYAIVGTDGKGYRELTLTANGNKLSVTRPNCLSWSWNNRYLAMCKTQPDQTSHLLKVSVTDGETQDMLGQTRSVQSAQFSPDDRFIAYSEDNGTRLPGFAGSVSIIPAQGGAPRPIGPGAYVTDWTPDGRYLLTFELPDSTTLSTAPSTLTTWAIPIQNGQVVGERVSIKGAMQPRTFANGTMVAVTRVSVQGQGLLGQAFLANLDSEGHLGRWTKLDDDLGAVADWSPDGQQIVYTSGQNYGVVRVRNLVTGEDREVYRSPANLLMCLWAHLQPKIYCAKPTPARTDIFSIALDSRGTENAGTLEGLRVLRRLSLDDRMLVTTKTGPGTIAPLEWEIGADPASEKPTRLYQSDDGRWLYGYDYPDGRRRIAIRSLSGDTDDVPRAVQTRVQPRDGVIGPVPVKFTPDSKWLVYGDQDADGKDVLYRMSVATGRTERLGDYPTSGGFFSYLLISPNGQQFIIGIQAPPKPPEFWVLENAIRPAAPSTPKRAVKGTTK